MIKIKNEGFRKFLSNFKFKPLGEKTNFFFLFMIRLINFFYENRINPTRYIKKQFLLQSGSVLHIGANVGQDRYFYDELHLRVLWIEGDPETCRILSKNLTEFPLQSWQCVLLGDKNLDEIDFYITNNNGMSSSIYKLKPNQIFADLEITGSKLLPIKRLEDILINNSEVYPYWVLDVQGAELQVLKGAGSYLKSCKYLELEISTWEVYLGQPLFEEIEEWLKSQGFFATWKPFGKFHENILFIRTD